MLFAILTAKRDGFLLPSGHKNAKRTAKFLNSKFSLRGRTRYDGMIHQLTITLKVAKRPDISTSLILERFNRTLPTRKCGVAVVQSS